VTLREHQPEAMAALDAAYDRARAVVDPDLLSLAQGRIDHIVAGDPAPASPRDDLSVDVTAVIDQMLIDVAGVSDGTVRTAGGHFADGELADLVMASYIVEARTRLRLMGDRLLGGGS
jgi:hypothetical protein